MAVFSLSIGKETFMADHDQWSDAQRLESWAGEVRVNFIRATGVVAFYGYHLINLFALNEEVRGRFHAAVTAIVFVWSFEIVMLHVCLARRYRPPALKFFSTGADLILITVMLMANRSGPHSPLVLLYFLVIASTPLRLSLPLVYAATFGSMAAGLLLVGHQYFVLIGPDNYYQSSERIPRTFQIIYLLSLGAAGILAGQAVRQARRLVEGHTVTVQDSGR
jgi:hypothetical protein